MRQLGIEGRSLNFELCEWVTCVKKPFVTNNLKQSPGQL